MHIFVLTILIFMSNHEPAMAAKAFGSRSECEITEGSALTAAQADPMVTGWKIIDECKDIGGKPTQG
jgi:hypothetical protein